MLYQENLSFEAASIKNTRSFAVFHVRVPLLCPHKKPVEKSGCNPCNMVLMFDLAIRVKRSCVQAVVVGQKDWCHVFTLLRRSRGDMCMFVYKITTR